MDGDQDSVGVGTAERPHPDPDQAAGAARSRSGLGRETSESSPVQQQQPGGEPIWACPQRLMDPDRFRQALRDLPPPGDSLTELVEGWNTQLLAPSATLQKPGSLVYRK
ncbi:Hypothetical predicted protein [Podarcis lilfordi]|uniref:Uncharacterized protein n=1 Tax=Podarcis lilfordi TaxID=74358 RepID=A0AA35KVI8_9SAUR|nr:Hypothetical predicted protein [Podarcis lilfordi]